MNLEGFPDELLSDDPESLVDARLVLEWCWTNVASPEDRINIRRRAEDYRTKLIETGHDLDNPHVIDGLWEFWYISSATWQTFISQDCTTHESEHLAFHATRALQWSGMVLLAALEKNLPNPDSEVSV